MAQLKDDHSTVMEVDFGGESGVIIHDTIWVAGGSSLRGFDIYTGEERLGTDGEKRYQYGRDFNNDPNIVGSFQERLIMITQNGKMYWADKETQELIQVANPGFCTWLEEADGYLFVSNEDGIIKYDSQADKVATYLPGTSRGNPCIFGDYLYFAYKKSSSGEKIIQLHLSDLSKGWECNVNGYPDTDLATDGKIVYYGTTNHYFGGIEIASGQEKGVWPRQFSGTQGQDIIKAQPAVSSDVVVFANSESEYINFYQPSGDKYKVMGSSTYQLASSDGTPPPAYGASLISDNILYLSSDRGVVYAIDLQSGISLTYENAGRIIDILDGVLYVTGNNTAGINFAEILREFYAETQLVQDYEFVDGSSTPTLLRTYSTEISLSYPDGSPRQDTIVRIQTNKQEESTIRIGTESYTVSRNDFAQVTTDGKGKVRVTLPADSLSSPTLLVWASFMEEGEHIVIYPDAQVHAQLGQLDVDSLKSGKSYDGASILTDGYLNSDDDDEGLTNAIAAISSTMGMTTDSKDTMTTKDKYLAAGCDDQTISCCDQRASECQILCNSPYFFSTDNQGGDFTSVDSGYVDLEAEQALSLAREYQTKMSAQPVSRNLWDDAWDIVTDEATEVKDFMVNSGEDVVAYATTVYTVIEDGIETIVEEVVELTVQTIEHAVKLVEEVVKIIAESVEDFIEFLSFLFDWDRIKAVQQDVLAAINDSFEALQDPDVANAIRDAVTATVNTLNATQGSLFTSLEAMLGVESTASQSQAASSSSGNDNTNQGGAKSNWMLQKMADNTSSDQTTASDQQERSLENIAIQLDSAAYDIMDDFLTSLEGIVEEDVMAALIQLQANWKSDTSSDLASMALADILVVVEMFVSLIFDILEVILTTAVEVWEQIIQFFAQLLNSTLSIPYVSDLYEWITEEELTLGNLLSFFIAIPMVLEEELTGNTYSYNQETRDVSQNPNGAYCALCSSFAQDISAFLTFLNMFATDEFKILVNWSLFTAKLSSRVLLVPYILEQSDGDERLLFNNFCLWTMPTMDLVNSLCFLCTSGEKDSGGDTPLGQTVSIILGVAHFGALIDIVTTDVFLDPDDIVFYSLAGVPLVIKLSRITKEGKVFEPIVNSIAQFTIATWRIIRVSDYMQDQNERDAESNESDGQEGRVTPAETESDTATSGFPVGPIRQRIKTRLQGK